MACRFINKSYLLWTTVSRLPFKNGVIQSSFILTRNFHVTESNWKKRKTQEERKAATVVAYSPKKRHDPNSMIVDVWRYMTVKQLSNCMKRNIEDVQEAMLYTKGAPDIHPSTKLDDLAIIRDIVKKCGMRVRMVSAPTSNKEENEEEKDRDVTARPPADEKDMEIRAPVVTVMGHVDHGKTTLLDSLRGASVAAGEAGGITQHIGAFTVELDNGEKVTFLDTPGHAAFSAMRARGANITDIIVMVVAADDGVMQQTKEVAALALKENVPIIVAINKIDKPDADVERTKQSLGQIGINLEGCGGDTQYVCISAKEGTNLEELAETVSTQATLMGLKADYKGLVEGVIVESSTHPHRGKLSTAIVTRGTLKRGALIVAGNAWAKVRAMFDHAGVPVEKAEPGMPVEILGWRELPSAGDEILEVESEKIVNSVMRWRDAQTQKQKAESDLDAIKAKQMEHDEQYKAQRDERRKMGKYKVRRIGPRPKEYVEDNSIPKVSVIIKGDVHGSVEAILDVLDTYQENHQVRLDIVHYGVGDVTQNDIELAKTFNAIIYAFSVSSPKTMLPKNVKINEVNIIYRLVDSLKEEINAKIPMVDVEEIVGEANVLQIFEINEGRKKVTVIGCRCTKGMLKKNLRYKIKRHDDIIFDGVLDSMKHLKNEVDTIKKDIECGLKPVDLNDVIVSPGDIMICYQINKAPVETEWDPGF